VEKLDDRLLILDTDEHNVQKLRRLQTITRLERMLIEIPYSRSMKEFRINCRKALIELDGIVTKESIVSARGQGVKRKRLLVILREIQRLFKCKLSRSLGDVDLSIRFLSNRYIVSLNVGTFQPLYRRWYTYYKSRASIHPIIAAAMSIIAGRSREMLDPFCGSLTIPIEYLRMWPCTYATCIDIDRVTVLNSIRNALLSEIYDRMLIILSDFFNIKLRKNYDLIVTDPPRGLRLRSSIAFYEKFFRRSIEFLSSNGKIVTIVFEKDLRRILRGLPQNFQVEMPLRTVQGGYRVCILSIHVR